MRFLLVLAKISKRAPKPPDIYSVKIQDTPHISYYQHSKNHEISTNFSENIKNFLGGSAPQTPSIIQPVNIVKLIYPSINIQQTMRFLLILAQKSKNFLGALPPDPLLYLSC